MAEDPVGHPPPRLQINNPDAQAAAAEIEDPPEAVDQWEMGREAHALLVAGHDWDEVIAQVGFESPEIARLHVQGYLSFTHVMTGDDERAFARRIQLDQLREIRKQWWDNATTMRDKDSAAVVLKAMDQEAKLLELYELSQRSNSSQTIVIMGDNMAADLRELALAMGQRDAVGPPAPAAPRVIEGAVVQH